MRIRGEKDLAISDGALRLLLRVCSFVHVSPKRKFDEPIPLPWSQVAIWCGLKDDKAARARIIELVERNYLKCDGLRGCPPINYFFLVSNCPQKGAIDSPRNGANVTPEKGAIVRPQKGAHHNNNSFQEERFKERGGNNSSLRSAETRGDLTVERDALRVQGVQVLRDFLNSNKRP